MSDQERYQQYLCSRAWSEKKEAVRRRSYGMCERCRVSPMQACHHLTYARKYDERLEDLQAICNQCHDFIHGKSDSDIHDTGLKIYLAGKISRNGWRHEVVSQLENTSPEPHEKWPSIRGAVSIKSKNGPVIRFDYCGPYFMSSGHGNGHGPGTHGRGEYCDHDDPENKVNTFERCFQAIEACDIFAAWIDSDDCFGTLVELGMAKSLGKQIWIGWQIRDANDVGSVFEDLWFAEKCADASDQSAVWQNHYIVELMNKSRRRNG